MHVTASKSFRVGKQHTDRPRLLIITLHNPLCKQDVLRGAPQLRNHSEYKNVYITPDLTQKERETNRKLREELATRRRNGETNLYIRGGRIVQGTARAAAASVTGSHAIGLQQKGDSTADSGSERQPVQPTHHETEKATGTPAVLSSGSGGHLAHQLPSQSPATAPKDCSVTGNCKRQPAPQLTVQSGAESPKDDSAPAVLSSGSRGQLALKDKSAPAVLSSGSRGQPTHQPTSPSPAEPSQDGIAPAVLCSGSREQPAHQQPVEPQRDDRAPAVPDSGSSGQTTHSTEEVPQTTKASTANPQSKHS